MELVRDFCKRIIWLQHGKIIADGPVDEVIEKYEKNILEFSL